MQNFTASTKTHISCLGHLVGKEAASSGLYPLVSTPALHPQLKTQTGFLAWQALCQPAYHIVMWKNSKLKQKVSGSNSEFPTFHQFRPDAHSTEQGGRLHSAKALML